MKEKRSPANDAVAAGFADEIVLCARKLARYCKDLTREELGWTPAGINNPILWILIHLATSLWVCHALLTGTRTRFDPMAAGLAVGAMRGIDFRADGLLPSVPPEDPTKPLREAWEDLQAVLRGADTSWAERRVYADRRMRPAWWFLIHELGDFAYHTGQACYLRKLIAAGRARSGQGTS